MTWIIGLFIGFYIGTATNNSPQTATYTNIGKEESITCPYVLKTNGSIDYENFLDDIQIREKPVFFDNSEIIELNKPFIEEEFELSLYQTEIDKGWEFTEFDVDGDGQDEMIIRANVAMNHTPHIAMIVKEGNIIFESEGANIMIEEVLGNGFLLHQTLDWIEGVWETTRYVYKDGGFLPIWTQKKCSATIEQNVASKPTEISPGSCEEKLDDLINSPDFVEFTGASHEVDFATMPEAETFRTRITEAVASGPNFAGRFTVATWGCGTSCFGYAVINSQTGKIISYSSANEGYHLRDLDLSNEFLVLDPLYAGQERKYYQIVKRDDKETLEVVCSEIVSN